MVICPMRCFGSPIVWLGKFLRRAVMFAGVAIAGTPVWAAPALELGIDRSGLSMQPGPAQQKALEDIRGLGATWFRDGPSSGAARGVANFVELVRRAKQLQLKVLVNIVQVDSDYDGDLAANRCGWKAKPLSRINLTKFADRLRALFGAIRAAGVTIDAVEFGNEDDSDCYDADVPSGRAATSQELATWLRGYGKFLQAGAEVLHDQRYFPHAQIITFGIAHGSDVWDKPPHHLLNPAQVMARLRNVDGVNYLDNEKYHVDGYGTHIYAWPNDIAASVVDTLRSDREALGGAKPLWVTEWGFLDQKAFPNKRGQDVAQAVTEMLHAFEAVRSSVPLGPVMFYRYDVWLTDQAGKLLPTAHSLSEYTKAH